MDPLNTRSQYHVTEKPIESRARLSEMLSEVFGELTFVDHGDAEFNLKSPHASNEEVN